MFREGLRKSLASADSFPFPDPVSRMPAASFGRATCWTSMLTMVGFFVAITAVKGRVQAANDGEADAKPP